MKAHAWLWFGIGGAIFAAAVNILSKTALKATDVFVALSLQSLLMLATLVTAATVMGRWDKVREMPGWAAWLLVASGVAGGLSWTFGYQCLQMADVSKATQVDKLSTVFALFMAVVFLKERPSVTNWIGVALILAGAVCVSVTKTASGK